MLSLDAKLHAALQSREQRRICRRLPDAAADDGLADFSTNDYLSLAISEDLRARFLRKLQSAPQILGSGGSRLLVNGAAHAALETRLQTFFDAPCALLFNSGFDANVGLFSCVPQPDDVVVFDEHIHASVHDGIRASRTKESSRVAFAHNSPTSLSEVLLQLQRDHPGLVTGAESVFVAVETLYSMDGTIAPLTKIVETVEELLPKGNGYVIVDEAHATGVYGPEGRGFVALLGLERRVFARLHTFGKALGGSGAVMLTTPLVHDYLLNYARSLIYTTSLSYTSVLSVDCSLDLLVDGSATALSMRLFALCAHFLAALRVSLSNIPPSLLALPDHFSETSTALAGLQSPIIPLLTPHPRLLSDALRERGLNARPITWPTVPKGGERVRVCLHAGNTVEEVERLVAAVVEWAQTWQEGSLQAKL
ncbi:predicted protein [Sparassis crispa]|uniref:Aminotransferase class I/classII large domain-containing protein n=1 Tax=Sparassis crispa TaxID=139825 RepID=A0A401H6U5_9APHY|nr:predicted protein [Sparassis crispa]GBE90109.1 predicted protein [Sparassis crispa]